MIFSSSKKQEEYYFACSFIDIDREDLRLENRGRYILGLESRADREERFHILNRIRGEERKVSGLGRGGFLPRL